MRAGGGLVDYGQIAADYGVLGLAVGSPVAEARSAFRRLIKRWHPDVSDQPADAAAHETRRLYQAFQRVRALSPHDLEAVRRRHRGAPGAAGPGRRGRDVVGDLVVTRQQARAGSRWRLRVATCHRCGGWGAAGFAEVRPCAACEGLGRYRRRDGSWDLDARCPHCQGHGCRVDEPCSACQARGDAGFYVTRFLVPGFATGEVAYRRVDGQGHPGVAGAPAGDLYLRIMTREAWQRGAPRAAAAGS